MLLWTERVVCRVSFAEGDTLYFRELGRENIHYNFHSMNRI